MNFETIAAQATHKSTWLSEPLRRPYIYPPTFERDADVSS